MCKPESLECKSLHICGRFSVTGSDRQKGGITAPAFELLLAGDCGNVLKSKTNGLRDLHGEFKDRF